MTRTQTWVALAALLATCFVGLGRDVWTPDEPREVEIGREMWLAPTVVPTLNEQRFVEKPPLYYWAVAGAYAAFGSPSAAAARAVSALAAFATLVLVVYWGRRAFSPAVGVAAAVALVTSAQFMWTSHWIVMDSLLMVFTTAALWSGHELVRGGANRKWLLIFYAAVLAALWTKGLIGPVLIAVALLAYAAARRSFAVLKPLHPFAGAAFVLLMVGALAAAIAADAGSDAVREWLWVNHVERVTNPVTTGHDQPVLYYLWTLPAAVFPWWLPFGALFRPSTWREPTVWRDAKVFFGAASIGMVLLLSVPATKRGLYLMPVLPPLLLLLAAVAAEWWMKTPSPRLTSAAWLAQSALVAVFAAVPAAFALGYLHVVDARAVLYLVVAWSLLGALAFYSLRGDGARALATLGVAAVAGVVGLLVAVVPLAAPRKDMSPFLSWVDEQVPADEPKIYVLGEVDETLDGIVPFVTGRHAVAVAADQIETLEPRFVLVQGKNGAKTAVTLAAPYAQLRSHGIGDDRYLALWSRTGDAPHASDEPRASDEAPTPSSSTEP